MNISSHGSVGILLGYMKAFPDSSIKIEGVKS